MESNANLIVYKKPKKIKKLKKLKKLKKPGLMNGLASVAKYLVDPLHSNRPRYLMALRG